jgi:hypothetical protein
MRDESNIPTPIDNADETITGEFIDIETASLIESDLVRSIEVLRTTEHEKQRNYLRYIFVPFIFLTVALLGGLRLSGVDGSFIFLKPALLCLVFASVLLVLFFRSGLIRLDGWFSEAFPLRKNIANGVVVLSLFAATTQLFNSLIPEQGLPFWIVSFCFLWTLWNNLFADFDTKKLLRSLGGLFGLAFVAKYLVLANLTAPAGQGWLRSMIENPAQQTMTWLLDLPQFSAGTGYIQFFAVALYLLGLYLFPSTTDDDPMQKPAR